MSCLQAPTLPWWHQWHCGKAQARPSPAVPAPGVVPRCGPVGGPAGWTGPAATAPYLYSQEAR